MRRQGEKMSILKYREQILDAVRRERVLVISGKTGCGKSTQVPQMLLENDQRARIAVCEPRRLAATSLAQWVAQSIGVKLGTVVGYHIGMEPKCSKQSSIIYMTYGIIIQKLMHGNTPYTHIILDEVHERSLEMDYSFIILKKILQHSHIKVIIMSATLNSKKFAAYFGYHPETMSFVSPKLNYHRTSKPNQKRGNRKIMMREGKEEQKRYEHQFGLQVFKEVPDEGSYRHAISIDLPDERPFKIDIKYLDDRTARIHYSVDQDIRIPQDAFDRASYLVLEHLEHKQGDVLVFLPGIRDIYALKKKIQGLKNNIQEDRFVIIHSQYAEGLNKRLFNKKVKNKIILSSSMGESSITLPNCVTIIDFCLSKSHASDKKTGQSTFQTHLSSKATLQQRAGRTGRVCDGEVFRLITKENFQIMHDFDHPEIKCISLELVILKAKILDYFHESQVFQDPYEVVLSILDPPQLLQIHRAVQFLVEEEALSYQNDYQEGTIYHGPDLKLTKAGEFIGQMPCDFHVSKMILCAVRVGIPNIILDIGAIMSYDKTIFTQEDRQASFENTLHRMIEFDEGLFNDYILNRKIYLQWRDLFFDERYLKQLDKKQKEKDQKSFNIFATSEDEVVEVSLAGFLRARKSEQQLNWCYDNGVSCDKLREILRLSQTIRLKSIQNGLNIDRYKQESSNMNLVLFCLCASFSRTSGIVSFQQQEVQNSHAIRKNQNCVSVSADFDLDLLKNYLNPYQEGRDYEIIQRKSIAFERILFYEIYGRTEVLLRLALPHKFDHEAKYRKNGSSAFLKCINSKIKSSIGDSFILHFQERRKMMNCIYSINEVVFKPDLQKQYYILSNKIILAKNKKTIYLSALIEEQVFILLKLLTGRRIAFQVHPSMEYIRRLRVECGQFEMKFNLTNELIQWIKSLRKNEFKNNLGNTFNIKGEQQEENQLALQDLLDSKKQILGVDGRWDHIYAKQVEGLKELDNFFDFQDLPELKNTTPSYPERYKKWKKDYYIQLHCEFSKLSIQQPCVICQQCYRSYKHINRVESLTNFRSETSNFEYQQFRRFWVEKDQEIYCRLGHYLGYRQNNQHIFLEFRNILMYKPFMVVQDFRGGEVRVNHFQILKVEKGRKQLDKQRKALQDYKCHICEVYYEEKEQIERELDRWKRRGQKKVVQKGPFEVYREFSDHMTSMQHLKKAEQFSKGIF